MGRRGHQTRSNGQYNVNSFHGQRRGGLDTTILHSLWWFSWRHQHSCGPDGEHRRHIPWRQWTRRGTIPVGHDTGFGMTRKAQEASRAWPGQSRKRCSTPSMVAQALCKCSERKKESMSTRYIALLLATTLCLIGLTGCVYYDPVPYGYPSGYTYGYSYGYKYRYAPWHSSKWKHHRHTCNDCAPSPDPHEGRPPRSLPPSGGRPPR